MQPQAKEQRVRLRVMAGRGQRGRAFHLCLRKSHGTLTALCLALLCGGSMEAAVVRIKDVATVCGTAGHKLVGYGLVVGLEGTGDSNRTLFTARALANFLENFGITVPAEALRADNVAAVVVTAELPAEAQVGTKLDVTVSSLGDAESLQGGVLLLTPLQAADGEVYALAQGPVSIGGFNVAAGGSKAQKNHPVVGRVPNGASVVRSVTADLMTNESVNILLHNPDFTTAMRVADAVNGAFGSPLARAVSQAVVEVVVPASHQADLVGFISHLEALPVEPDVPARVVVNERTGTVIISGNARILPVAIAHGALTVEIKTRWEVSQPPPLIESHRQETTILAPAAQATARGGAEQSQGPAPRQPAAASAASASGPAEAGQEARAGSAGASTGESEAGAPATGKPMEAAGGEQAGQGEGRGTAPAARGVVQAQAVPGGPAPAPAVPAQRAGGPSSSPTAPLPLSTPGPGALTGGRTVMVPETEIKAHEGRGQLYAVPEQASLRDLVEALNALGVTPRDLIAIIQALKELGALEAELIMQ
jgi:flagellar P-ring protein precursor FlgI